MKTKNLVLVMTLLFVAGSIGSLQAQEHLSALMKKCESMDKVDIQVLYEKDPKTKKPEKNIVTVTFRAQDHPKLHNDFLDAFRKDRESAYKVIENKQNGKIVPSFYRFIQGKNDVSYSFNFTGDMRDRVQITCIERFDEHKE